MVFIEKCIIFFFSNIWIRVKLRDENNYVIFNNFIKMFCKIFNIIKKEKISDVFYWYVDCGDIMINFFLYIWYVKYLLL